MRRRARRLDIVKWSPDSRQIKRRMQIIWFPSADRRCRIAGAAPAVADATALLSASAAKEVAGWAAAPLRVGNESSGSARLFTPRRINKRRRWL